MQDGEADDLKKAAEVEVQAVGQGDDGPKQPPPQPSSQDAPTRPALNIETDPLKEKKVLLPEIAQTP